MAALFTSSVGIDLEVVKPLKRSVCEYFLTESELPLLCNSPYSDDVTGILLFTQKESVLKADGCGIAGGLQTTIFNQLCLDKEFMVDFKGASYRICSSLHGECILSLAVKLKGDASE
jgi:phosphopantetheinyl transferase